MCRSHAQGNISAARLILRSSTLARNVSLPFICKLHWAPGIAVNWPGSGLSHISNLKSGKIMNPSQLCYGSWPTPSIFGFCNCSKLGDLTPYTMSSPSVRDVDAMLDPSVGQLEQGVWGWESS